jgi:hypothetical protein
VGHAQQLGRDTQAAGQAHSALGVEARMAVLDRAKGSGWDAGLERKLY